MNYKMRKMNSDGLGLSSLQGDVFSSSITRAGSSSEIFIRRFMLSKVAKEFDSLSLLDDSLSKEEIFVQIEEEYGNSHYGKKKYPAEVLFWIGYLYRYMAFTYELSSSQIYRLIKPKELFSAYYTYHTLDCRQAIERILEEKGVYFGIEEENRRLLNLLRKKRYDQKVKVASVKPNGNQGIALREKIKDYCRFVLEEPPLSKKDAIFKLEYKEQEIGSAAFKRGNELLFISKKETLANKDLLSVEIEKILNEIRKSSDSKSVYIKLPKSEENSISLFKNLRFSYWKENERFVFLKSSL